MNIIELIRKRGFACSYNKIKRKFFIKDEHIISHIALLGAYDYLQKYKYVLRLPIEKTSQDSINPYSNKIWTCWLQGIDKAPAIVQKCVNSIKNQHNNNLVLLNSTNIEQYIKIPAYITEKWRIGIIGNAHYSDVIRISILAKYGGIWIDSTSFLFDKIPEYITELPLFCFKSNNMIPVVASNWFISAKPNNHIIMKVKNLLYEYWKKEKKVASYSIFHLFFAMAVNGTDETKKQWQSVPYFDDVNCKVLQNELFNSFDNIRLEQIKQMSVIQKLSYKFSREKFDEKGTFYDRLHYNF